MRPDRSRVPNEVAGLLCLVAVAVGLYFAFGGPTPLSHRDTVTAVFRDANNIHPGSPARIAGVTVGEVTKVRSIARGEAPAAVTIALDMKGLHLHRDAVLEIRPRTFLEGNFFVEIHPGTPAAPPLPDGGTIPVQQTKSTVQLGQVLTALQADSRHDLQTALQTLAKAARPGATAAFNRSTRLWAPAYRDTAISADAARGVAGDDVPAFLRSGGRVAAALDRDPSALRALIANLDRTAAAFADAQDGLSAAVAELPRTLRAAAPALTALDAALPPLRRLAVRALPGARAAGPALAAGTPLLRQLDGLAQPDELGRLTPQLAALVPRVAKLGAVAPALLDELRLAASCATEVVLPWSHQTVPDKAFPASGPVFEELPKTLPGVAGESRTMDANGQWIRVLSGSGNFAYADTGGSFLLSTRPLIGVNPPPPAKRPALRPDVPCETQVAPDLASTPAAPPPGRKVDTTSRAALALQGRALHSSNRFVTRLLRLSHLTDRLSIATKPLLRGQVRLLQKAAPAR